MKKRNASEEIGKFWEDREKRKGTFGNLSKHPDNQQSHRPNANNNEKKSGSSQYQGENSKPERLTENGMGGSISAPKNSGNTENTESNWENAQPSAWSEGSGWPGDEIGEKDEAEKEQERNEKSKGTHLRGSAGGDGWNLPEKGNTNEKTDEWGQNMGEENDETGWVQNKDEENIETDWGQNNAPPVEANDSAVENAQTADDGSLNESYRTGYRGRGNRGNNRGAWNQGRGQNNRPPGEGGNNGKDRPMGGMDGDGKPDLVNNRWSRGRGYSGGNEPRHSFGGDSYNNRYDRPHQNKGKRNDRANDYTSNNQYPDQPYENNNNNNGNGQKSGYGSTHDNFSNQGGIQGPLEI